jgi:hypothetical protein
MYNDLILIGSQRRQGFHKNDCQSGRAMQSLRTRRSLPGEAIHVWYLRLLQA